MELENRLVVTGRTGMGEKGKSQHKRIPLGKLYVLIVVVVT